MNWCITPADVSALRSALGPIIYVCAILGTVTAVGIVAALNAIIEWLDKREESPDTEKAMNDVYDRMDLARFEEELAQCNERIAWMAGTAASFHRVASGRWFVSFERDCRRHQGPLADDIHQALAMAVDYEKLIALRGMQA